MKRLSIIVLAILLASCGTMRKYDTSGSGNTGGMRANDYQYGGANFFPGMDPTFSPYFGE